MSIDLYKDDLGAATASDLYDAIESFTGVTLPEAERAPEGYLLDFKEKWNDSAVKTVAAFANTFGGLLLVGVSENSARADHIVGVAIPPRQEFKTSIASSIASNISPTPPYEIWDLPLRDDQTKKLCIVRVRKGSAIYFCTKKGESPVYVRNDAESRPADAAQLQALLATRTPRGRPRNVASSVLRNFLFVTNDATDASAGQRTRSNTSLSIEVTPEERRRYNLDLAIEQKILSIIFASYPYPIQRGVQLDETRARSWYQNTFRNKNRDFEMHWAVDDAGEFHLCTQVRVQSPSLDPAANNDRAYWSLYDLMTNIDSTIKAANEFWQYLGYIGEGRLKVLLNLERSLELLQYWDARLGDAVCIPGFYAGGGYADRSVKALVRSSLGRSSELGAAGSAEVEINFATRFSRRAETVAVATNQVLRDLGYAASLADLEKCLS